MIHQRWSPLGVDKKKYNLLGLKSLCETVVNLIVSG